MHVLGAPKGQKRTLNPLERELWMVASHSWVLGMEYRSFARATRALKRSTLSTVPNLLSNRQRQELDEIGYTGLEFAVILTSQAFMCYDYRYTLHMVSDSFYVIL